VKTRTDQTDGQIEAQVSEKYAKFRSGDLSGPETDQTDQTDAGTRMVSEGAHGGNGHDDDLTILPFLDRRHEVCAQCLAGGPDDPPTAPVTAKNGETVYVHERGCLKFWKRDHGNGACP
jgi:hypothetical protein